MVGAPLTQALGVIPLRIITWHNSQCSMLPTNILKQIHYLYRNVPKSWFDKNCP